MHTRKIRFEKKRIKFGSYVQIRIRKDVYLTRKLWFKCPTRFFLWSFVSNFSLRFLRITFQNYLLPQGDVSLQRPMLCSWWLSFKGMLRLLYDKKAIKVLCVNLAFAWICTNIVLDIIIFNLRALLTEYRESNLDDI